MLGPPPKVPLDGFGRKVKVLIKIALNTLRDRIQAPKWGTPPPIGRADKRNAPKGAQRARRLADAREESNTAGGKHEFIGDGQSKLN